MAVIKANSSLSVAVAEHDQLHPAERVDHHLGAERSGLPSTRQAPDADRGSLGPRPPREAQGHPENLGCWVQGLPWSPHRLLVWPR